MNFNIPQKYRLFAAIGAVAVLAFAFYVANFVFSEGDTTECCATETSPAAATTPSTP
jgi:hypothetical protein